MAKSILFKQGYQISKVHARPMHTLRADHSHRGKVIEFIGPSGVGKTYLFEKSRTSLRAHWKPVTTPIGFKVHFGFAPPYWSLLTPMAQRLTERSLNDYQRAGLLQYYSSIIAAELEMSTQLARSSFMLDEGIFHNFSEQLMELEDSAFSMATSSRAIILVLPSRPETVMERRSQRFPEGDPLDTPDLTNAEQLELIESNCAALAALAARAETFGVKCLRIAAEDPTEKTLASVTAFGRRLIGT